jgi:hypothetical protein
VMVREPRTPTALDHSTTEIAEIRIAKSDVRMLRDALNEALGEGSKT